MDALNIIPLCSVKAGPIDDKDKWEDRLKEEYMSLISYIEFNKDNNSDWFYVESDEKGTLWEGTCWHTHDNKNYTFKIFLDVPDTYPNAPPDIRIPQLEGLTAKMYKGGKICLDAHFAPLWQKNSPKYGIAHSLSLGLAPWLAAEIPHMVSNGLLQ